MFDLIWCAASLWTVLSLWSMPLEMMMTETEGMDTVLIEEAMTLLMGDMVVVDPPVHIVEVGVAQIMVMDQIHLPDQIQEEAPSMNELKAQ